MAATYTPQQIIDACDDATYKLVTERVESYTWLGRTVTHLDLKHIAEVRRTYVGIRDAAAGGAAGGVALGVFGDPR